MGTFDPTLPCPIIRNMGCAKEDCGFYNTVTEQCLFYDMVNQNQGTNDYNEVVGTISGAVTDTIIDLGQVFKDVTLWVNAECTVKLHDATRPSIAMTSFLNRVGVPMTLTNINARYVLITTSGDTSYCVVGNG